LETTYEGTKLVKSAKLQMLISRFEEIKMLEEETFGEFYSILRSLPEHFRIKVTTIEESKDLEEMKIEESWSDLFKLMSCPCPRSRN